jgi:hypothetical protein
MKYSVWFPTHGVEKGTFRSWLDELFSQPAYELDAERQAMVARAIREVCLDRGWQLMSVEPRELDVYAVVESGAAPERIIHDFKIAASLALTSLDGEGPKRKRFNRRSRVREIVVAERAAAAKAGDGQVQD